MLFIEFVFHAPTYYPHAGYQPYRDRAVRAPRQQQWNLQATRLLPTPPGQRGCRTSAIRLVTLPLRTPRSTTNSTQTTKTWRRPDQHRTGGGAFSDTTSEGERSRLSRRHRSRDRVLSRGAPSSPMPPPARPGALFAASYEQVRHAVEAAVLSHPMAATVMEGANVSSMGADGAVRTVSCTCARILLCIHVLTAFTRVSGVQCCVCGRCTLPLIDALPSWLGRDADAAPEALQPDAAVS